MAHPLHPRFHKYPVHVCADSPPSGAVRWRFTYEEGPFHTVGSVEAQTWYFARAQAEVLLQAAWKDHAIAIVRENIVVELEKST